MSIDDPSELEAQRRAGAVVAATLREVRDQVRPGVRTAELDEVAARVFRRHGARRLRSGQIVKLDVTAELDGFYADACVTVPVGEVEPQRRRHITAADVGLKRGIAAARAGAAISAIVVTGGDALVLTA